jgi:hypothetical protein
MRVSAIIVVLLGVAALVFGVLFVIEASSAEQEVADSIQPLPLAQLDAQYDAVAAQHNQMKEAGTPPGVEYNYLTIQKTGLGLARANVGVAGLVRTHGIIDIIVGVGLILAGVGLYMKGQSAA